MAELQHTAVDGTRALAGQAEAFDRGNAAAEHETYGKGMGIVSDAGPGGMVWVEYDVEVPAEGAYQLEFRYAAA